MLGNDFASNAVRGACRNLRSAVQYLHLVASDASGVVCEFLTVEIPVKG